MKLLRDCNCKSKPNELRTDDKQNQAIYEWDCNTFLITLPENIQGQENTSNMKEETS